jgi:hypothetical protein
MSDGPQERNREPWSYRGEARSDAEGRAVVVLPAFVRAHRAGFEYELTPLRSNTTACVFEEIDGDRFTVATDRPHVKVAWRVTAMRDEHP